MRSLTEYIPVFVLIQWVYSILSVCWLYMKHTRRLPGTVNWGTATVVGIFAGMLYGGSKEPSSSLSKDAEVTLKLGSTLDKREQYRLMRDAMEKRFVRVTRGRWSSPWNVYCHLLWSTESSCRAKGCTRCF